MAGTCMHVSIMFIIVKLLSDPSVNICTYNYITYHPHCPRRKITRNHQDIRIAQQITANASIHVLGLTVQYIILQQSQHWPVAGSNQQIPARSRHVEISLLGQSPAYSSKSQLLVSCCLDRAQQIPARSQHQRCKFYKSMSGLKCCILA